MNADYETSIPDIPAPPVHAFRDLPSCPACGLRPARSFWDRLTTRLFRHLPDSAFRIEFCAGGKEPTETRTRTVLFGAVNEEVHWPCAGHFQPHLHLQCFRCGYHTLSKLKGGSR